jgi:DNA replication protein DnaC
MQNIGQAVAAALKTSRTTAESPTSSGWKPTLDAYHPDLVRAAEACAKFAADMEREAMPYWLTLSGPQGSGKTMLSRQLHEFAAKNCNPGRHSLWVAGTGVYEESNRRPNCVWLEAYRMAERMRGGEFDLPEYLRPDYLVVVDDLGSARDKTDFLADGLYRLADQRSHKWMIWTTNLTLKEISANLDPRISSRLIRDDNRIITINAPDYALRRR